MARPSVCDETRITTAVRLPESLHARLRHAAAVRDVSANLLITRAVQNYLDCLPDLDAVLAPSPTMKKGTR